MAAKLKLSGAELEIAQIVFRLGEARVRDVAKAMPAEREMDLPPVKTYLRGIPPNVFLAMRRGGGAFFSRPGFRRAGVVRGVVRDLVDRLFAGDALPLVQHLISDRTLSDAQLDELQAMLDQLKAKRKGKS